MFDVARANAWAIPAMINSAAIMKVLCQAADEEMIRNGQNPTMVRVKQGASPSGVYICTVCARRCVAHVVLLGCTACVLVAACGHELCTVNYHAVWKTYHEHTCWEGMHQGADAWETPGLHTAAVAKNCYDNCVLQYQGAKCVGRQAIVAQLHVLTLHFL